MATLTELVRDRTDFDTAVIDHLQRLVGSWGLLADLSFADLLLFTPAGEGETGRFVVLGQMRPSTSQTLHREDLVGQVIDEVERPLVARAWRLGEIVEGELTVASGERARLQCIPVRYQGQMLAVLTREAPLSVGRRPGELERVYVQAFSRFARMIVNGEFPFANDDADVTEESPRVSDGLLLLDPAGRIEYASPNAVNALHRMGVDVNTQGMLLGEAGVDDAAVRLALQTASPVTEEVERRADVIVLLRCIPLLDAGRVTGAILLLRDVTDIRRRDRLLLSKDATIREVHHRVKNNLQTISSLLRLQARRLEAGSSRTALNEAERRIRSIALVHEILSQEPGDEVPFGDIVKPLVRMAEDGVLSSERHVLFTTTGDPGELPASVATPLAVVLTELLQNAAEHGFPDGDGQIDDGTVEVQMRNSGTELSVRVCDNGVGLPEGFDVERTSSLGLSIVREMVTSQLGGTIGMHTDDGTIVELSIPLRSE